MPAERRETREGEGLLPRVRLECGPPIDVRARHMLRVLAREAELLQLLSKHIACAGMRGGGETACKCAVDAIREDGEG